MEKIAYVLGGGSIKGIWQMGAINNVLESHRIHPEIITGISVGNLNGHLLANRVGEHYTHNPTKIVKWHEVSAYLKDFWFSNITCPNDLAYKKSAVKLIWELIRGKFNGFSDTTPLRELINKTIQLRYLERSRLAISSGCVNLEEGKILYTNLGMSNYNQYILSSSAIPFMMPVEEIGTLKFIDGGLIDSAPLGKAIKMGATKLIVIANHPKKVGHRAINHNNPLVYADRLMEIIVNNTLNNDIMEAELINELIKNGVKCKKTDNKKVIDIRVIRPPSTIDLKIDNFNTDDIKKTWQMGWDVAKNCILR
jgi:NTE family protein